MKKPFTAIVMAMAAVVLASCYQHVNLHSEIDSAKSVGDIIASATDAGGKVGSAATPVPAITSIQDRVLFDKDNIRITGVSFNIDKRMGPIIKINIENNSNGKITAVTSEAAINGFMIGSVFIVDVDAGGVKNSEIFFSTTDMIKAGISTIKDIEFAFEIRDSESFDSITDSDIIHLQTASYPDYVQPIDDSGFVALDRNKIKVVFKKLSRMYNFVNLDVYIENNSKEAVTVQVRDAIINGTQLEPVLSCDLLPGKKAMDSISFLEEELGDKNITDIEDLELSFTVIDTLSFDPIFDSNKIKVVFTKAAE